jgi:hypothetical protein
VISEFQWVEQVVNPNVRRTIEGIVVCQPVRGRGEQSKEITEFFWAGVRRYWRDITYVGLA